jgi:Family of unknown function (DUF6884)
MTRTSSILVLTSCTASKVHIRPGEAVPAEDLYTGQQHVRLMRGVHTYRSAGEPQGPLDLRILSAGHGVVASSTLLRPYDATFVGMSRASVRRAGHELAVPEAVRGLLGQRRRLAVLLLGEDYLHATALTPSLRLGAPTIAFASPKSVRRLPQVENLHPIPLDNRDAKRFSCGLIGLKGDLAARLLTRLAAPATTPVPLDDVALLDWLTLCSWPELPSGPALAKAA